MTKPEDMSELVKQDIPMPGTGPGCESRRNRHPAGGDACAVRSRDRSSEADQGVQSRHVTLCLECDDDVDVIHAGPPLVVVKRHERRASCVHEGEAAVSTQGVSCRAHDPFGVCPLTAR